MTIERIQKGPRMSQVVVHGGVVYLSGQVADDPQGDAEQQTREILAKIDDRLESAGTDKSKLLAANVWLTHMSDFRAMNSVWDAWVDPNNPPARACVEARLARPELLVEIMVTAAR